MISFASPDPVRAASDTMADVGDGVDLVGAAAETAARRAAMQALSDNDREGTDGGVLDSAPLKVLTPQTVDFSRMTATGYPCMRMLHTDHRTAKIATPRMHHTSVSDMYSPQTLIPPTTKYP